MGLLSLSLTSQAFFPLPSKAPELSRASLELGQRDLRDRRTDPKVLGARGLIRYSLKRRIAHLFDVERGNRPVDAQ